jgi:cyclic pyranopterin phosphate synthase
MPEEGIRYLPNKELLTFEEIERLITLLASMGVSKVRLTGGEPFVRNDLMELIRTIVAIPGIDDLHITTNGVLTSPHIAELKALGVASVNLSLDTLHKDRFKSITRRDVFDDVVKTYSEIIDHQIPLKINAVVMEGKNIDDIVPLIELTKRNPIAVRFIEEMPFNGEGNHYPTLHWTYTKILEYITECYPNIYKIQDPENSTSYHYGIPGHRGKIGIIAAFSRTFCGSCNRIRITAQGGLKTCLYDDGVLDIKAMMRQGATNEELTQALLKAFSTRPLDGFEAEQKRKDHLPVHESMSTIGG